MDRKRGKSPVSVKQALRDYRHRTIAIAYDFDETLSPQSMQEYTVFPELKIQPAAFWKQVKEEASRNQATEVLTYMRMMAEIIGKQDLPFDKDRMKQLGANVPYFPGVESWFERINTFVKEQSRG